MDEQFILPLDAAEAALDRVGGKGANLARLARKGFPIPGGFLITTEAYRAFVSANDLTSWIAEQIRELTGDNPQALQEASSAIRDRFAAGNIPADLAESIRGASADLGRTPVAVRSSATAEDLPDLSFAGQQDTFLNITGEDGLLQAVVQCWSSLWTGRAIGYRARNRIDPLAVSLAIVVQTMVPSEASGVLFTANPLSGMRVETVIDATLGLGEALVSGQVEPDHYVVSTIQGQIVEKVLGEKALATIALPQGGVETRPVNAAGRQALSDEQILALARLGERVENEYGFPQDIEWALAHSQLFLLQSRPITSLYPLPGKVNSNDLHAYFSFGAVQGVLEPFTPLGQDAARLLAAGTGKLFGVRFTHETQPVLLPAGERIWIDITGVLRNPIGHRVVPIATGLVEPSVGELLSGLRDDPRLLPTEKRLRPRTIWRLVRFAVPMAGRVIRNWIDPDGRRAQFTRMAEGQQAALEAAASELPVGRVARLARRLSLFDALYNTFPDLLIVFASAVAGAMSLLNLLNHLAAGLPVEAFGESESPGNLALKITRGLPNNVTTEMDLRLWATAQKISADPVSLARFEQAAPDVLAADYQNKRLPPTAQAAVHTFLEKYGMRGVGEIDIGRPRWQEQPLPIFQVLQSYINIQNVSQAPDVVFERGARTAEDALQSLEAALRRTHGGWFKARLARWAAGRYRALAGLRESPKFYIIRRMDVIRRGMLDSGREYAEAGWLTSPDDLFFLHFNELIALVNLENQDNGRPATVEDPDMLFGSLAPVETPLTPTALQALVAARRATYQREHLRRQIPRVILSDGRTYYQGLGGPDSEAAGELSGSPVSPGVSEGRVRVVLNPHSTQLEPGEILVCPGTDPAWTPLFMAAAGLIMEVGGMMTHGSVVAREYGIPAVVGVDQATTRLKTGQRVRVNGSTGHIQVLDTPE